MFDIESMTAEEVAEHDAEYQQWLDSMEADYEDEQFLEWAEIESDRLVANYTDEDLDRMFFEHLEEHWM